MSRPTGSSPDPDGSLLRVHVRPEGAANTAVLALLAELLDLPPRDVVVESGAHGRDKRVRVRGRDAAAVRARLEPRLRVDRGGAGG